MNDATHEQLSALLDGELPRDELRFLLRRLDSDSTLARRWSRYQIVSAVLKREYPASASEQFVSGVMSRLDAEAPHAAPRAGMASRVLRWAGGGAIAASVAVVALLATRPAGTELASPAPGNPAVAVVAAAPATTPSAPVGELHQPLLPQQQMLPAGFANYAQPASFESIVPNYTPAPRNSGGQATNDSFVPYMLLGARQPSEQPQQPARPEAPRNNQ
jgi:sigma-E factor negative regulatory protein RseA